MKKVKSGTVLVNCLSIGIIAVFFVFNLLSPLSADDFGFSFSKATGERLSSMRDIILSQYVIYQGISGRCVGIFFEQLFLAFNNTIVFDIFNTIVYVCFILLLQFHITGTPPKESR